jgi:hypothetical protein
MSPLIAGQGEERIKMQAQRVRCAEIQGVIALNAPPSTSTLSMTVAM